MGNIKEKDTVEEQNNNVMYYNLDNKEEKIYRMEVVLWVLIAVGLTIANYICMFR